MELRHLKYFIVVAEELNFRRAAERLGIAQPPLSKQIRDLELELEAKLFERNQKRVLLTKAGKVFLQEVRLVMAQVDLAVTRTRQAHQGGAAKISIGFSAPAQQLLSKVLETLKNITPELEVSLQELTGAEQLSALKSGRLDLGLGYLPDLMLVDRGGLATKAIQQEKLCLAVPDKYPGIGVSIEDEPPLETAQISQSLLSKKMQPPPIGESLGTTKSGLYKAEQEKIDLEKNHEIKLSIDILKTETLILAKEQWGDYAEIRLWEVLQKVAIKPLKIQEVLKMETALSLVAQNRGVTLITSAFKDFRRSGVSYIDLIEPMTELQIGMIWRVDSRLDFLEKLVSLINPETLEKV
jgi:DNA-binding transcriptional LysR family regulator